MPIANAYLGTLRVSGFRENISVTNWGETIAIKTANPPPTIAAKSDPNNIIAQYPTDGYS